ncbi:MAG: dihydroxy-acid dehydratase, partial [Pseudomonadales bacterium]
MHATVAEVTETIRRRSHTGRSAYLERITRQAEAGPVRGSLSCSNLAHGMAACSAADKGRLTDETVPNIAIVTAYNDMLSAHQPYASYPAQIKAAAEAQGAVAQVAGGVPAMCDGVTQGREGMELSLFSRDVIALSTAVALSHNMFDAAMYLGICDKIVPGLLMGALSFGHLPGIFVPAGPMRSGLPNKEKAKTREAFAEGKIGRSELIAAESAAYHSAGTCTFYGTANSNQMLMEVMGLQLPGSSFINPDDELRPPMTVAAVNQVLANLHSGNRPVPLGEMLDEAALVNGIVGLLATGGSTNHTMHLVAIAAAAGISINWSDMSALSKVVPLLVQVYPNGSADVNHFHQAGGLAVVIAELISAGLLHEDVLTVAGDG